MTTDLEEAIKACETAFYAEYQGEFEKALPLHSAALEALDRVIRDGKVLTREPVRLAKMQLKVHQLRRETLQNAVIMKTTPALLLPSFFAARDELSKKCLSTVSQDSQNKSSFLPCPRFESPLNSL
jgi:hypothetical protein